MYEISAQAEITADAETVWAVVADVNGWPAWDPHEEAARLEAALRQDRAGLRAARAAVPVLLRPAHAAA